MNFVGKFDAKLPVDGAGAHADAHVTASHVPAGAIIVPDAQLLFTGDFKRAGVDLILSRDDHELVLHDYFKGEKRATLASPDGAHLTGDLVNALTGHVEYAQADGSAGAGKIIGHVTKLAGSATAVRNGVSIVLNQGDNVEKGDVVQSGSGSTVSITFIDGTVFGLSSNARMVLNEMIYDPNGSNNSSLMSLVAGTISFVAGETAKHGDMKVDTPVATMGIRGTAVLVEIDFDIPGQNGTPDAKFQVLVEPDGTTGSYILYDKTTLAPIATVNQAGQQINISQGVVSQTVSGLSADVQKLITEVFAQKFTDNTNTKTFDHFTDTPIPVSLSPIMLANGTTATPIVLLVTPPSNPGSGPSSGPSSPNQHVDQAPTVVTFSDSVVERPGVTHSSALDTASGIIRFVDINAGDTPTVKTTFGSYSYQNAQHTDVTATLTSQQIADITAVEAKLTVVPDPGNNNGGFATWTYSVADGALDFLAAGETLILTYVAEVDSNYAPNNLQTFKTFTVTITGTNDAPTIATAGSAILERVGTGLTAADTATGTVTFTDVDLTDRPVVSASFGSFKYLDSNGHDVTSTLSSAQLSAVEAVETNLVVTQAAGNTNNGSASWSYSLPDKSFDFLAQGETLILNYVAQVDDGHGGVVSTPITVSVNGADVTITGTNDLPVITSLPQIGTITEMSNPNQPNPTGSTAPDTATGTITFTDVDLSDTHTVTVTGVAAAGVKTGLPSSTTLLSWISLGVVTDSTNGVTGWDGWTFSAQDKSFDYLAAGETVTLTYTLQVADDHGGTATQNVTVTVTGTNDTPTIAATSAAFSEASNPIQPNPTGSTTLDTVTGTISFTDVDLSDTHIVTVTQVVASGVTTGLADNATQLSWMSLGALTDTVNGVGGSDGWTFSAADNSFDYLAAGQTLILTYTAQVDDGHGGVITTPFTVTITGTNDTPTIAATSAAFSEASNPSQPNPTGSTALDTATGTISFTDVDLSDTHTVTITGVVASGVTAGLADHATQLSWMSLGTLTDTVNGVGGSDGWTFSAADNSFDYLAAGQTVTLTYTAQVDDGHGGVITTPFTVTITGTNDTPIISATSAAFSEVSNPSQPNPTGSTTLDTVTGTISFTDVDLSDTHTVTVTQVVASGVTTGLADHATQLSWMSLGALTDTVNGVGGSDGWTFSAADNSFDYLAAGQTLILTYTAQVDDGHGGVITTPFTVTITGTNDTPTIAATSAAFSEASNPSQPNPTGSTTLDTATGTISFTDVDLSDTHTVTITGVVASGVTAGLADHATQLSWMSLGTLTDTVNGVGGSDGWTFSAADNSFDYLAAGQTVTLTYTAQVDDGHGGVITTPFTVTITGTNDTPTIAATSAAFSEASNPSQPNPTGSTALDTATGTISFTDVDLSDTHTVTITGVVASGVTAGLADHATQLSWMSLGTLTDTVNGVGGSDGWTFSAADNSFDYLAAGQTLILTYTAQVDDGHGGVITTPFTVTITGTNDTPTIAATSAAFSEVSNPSQPNPTGSTTLDTATGTISFTDVDLSDTHIVTVTQVVASGVTTGLADHATQLSWMSLGALTDTVNGVGGSDGWTFSAADNSFDYLAAGQTLILTYTAQVDDGHGGVITTPFTVTITGTNDTPTIAATSAAFSEASNPSQPNPTGSTALDTATGTISFTDVDLSDTHIVTVTQVVASGVTTGLADNATQLSWMSLGALTDTVNGVGGSDGWTFSAADNSFDYLAAGQTLILTYTAQVDDGHGGVITTPFTVTITGTNDTPTIAATSAAFSEASNPSQPNPTGSTALDTVTGTISFTDVDLSDIHTVTVTQVVASGVTTGLADHATQLSWMSLGTLTDTVNGVGGSDGWTFSAADNSFDYLAAGQTVTLTYTAQVDDGHGGVSTTPFTVTVTGTNDAPVLNADASGPHAITETADVTGSSAVDTASGTLAFTDVDLSDTHTVSHALLVYALSSGSLNTPEITALNAATLTLVEHDSTGTGAGSIDFTYSAADSSFDFLAAGQTLTVIYSVTVTDNSLVASTQPVTFTITGTNDAPVADAHGATLAYTENQAPTAIDTGLTLSDVDSTTLASATVQISGNFVAGEDVLGFTDQNGIHGSYDPATGELSLTGTASVADYQAALASVTYFDSSDNPSGLPRTVSFTVNDGAGENSQSNTATATVNVTPVDDAPVIAPVAGVSTAENHDVTISGLSVSDVDAGTAPIEVTLVAGQGSLALTNLEGLDSITGNESGTVNLFGSQAAIDAALAHVFYDPSLNYYGPDTLTVTANDEGNTGSGGPLSTTEQIALTVTAVPMLNSMTLTVSQGGTDVLTAADFSVSNPESTDFYSVQNSIGGQFEVFNGTNWVSALTGGFTDAQIAAGQVEFVQDGTATAPNFMISVSDGHNGSPAISPTVNFSATPPTAINESYSVLGISPSVASTIIFDASAPSGDSFTVTGVSHGTTSAVFNTADGAFESQGSYGELYVYPQAVSHVTVGGFTDTSFQPGDLVLVVDTDPSDPVHTLAPGATLTDVFGYTITDSVTGLSSTATATFTYSDSDIFTGTSGGSWSTAGNWMFGVPTSSSGIPAYVGQNEHVDVSGATIGGLDIYLATSFGSPDPNGGPTPDYSGMLTVASGQFAVFDGVTLHGGTLSGPGTFEIGSGSSAFSGVTVDTSVQIDAGASLTVTDGTGGTFAFAAGTGALVLDTPGDFSGVISGFTGTAPDAAHSDTIDVVGIDYESADFHQNYDPGTGLLTLNVGANSATLDFVGFSGNLVLASDNNGGTTIFDPPATPSPTIASGGSLEIGNAVAPAETVTFQGSTGSLTLDTPSSFHGTVAGFTGDGTLQGSDQIDLKGIDYHSSAFAESFNASTDTLSVTDGTDSAALHFTGNYVAANFSFTTDGDGGTIVYDPPVTANPALAPAKPAAPSVASATSHGFVFNFAEAAGHDAAADFHPTADDHHSMPANAQGNLAVLHDDGHGNTAMVPDGHDPMALAGIIKAQLHADFHFV